MEMAEAETHSIMRQQISTVQVITTNSPVDLTKITIAILSQFHLLGGNHRHQILRADLPHLLQEVMHHMVENNNSQLNATHSITLTVMVRNLGLLDTRIRITVAEGGIRIEAAVGTSREDNVVIPIEGLTEAAIRLGSS